MDRAALDAAMSLGLECGGWVPRGRTAEDGIISEKYPLKESGSADYSVRTRLNAEDSDATLIINDGELEGGTLYTLRICEKTGKPVEILDAGDPEADVKTAEFIVANSVLVLNVAGPRESKRPGIYERTLQILIEAFQKI